MKKFFEKCGTIWFIVWLVVVLFLVFVRENDASTFERIVTLVFGICVSFIGLVPKIVAKKEEKYFEENPPEVSTTSIQIKSVEPNENGETVSIEKHVVTSTLKDGEIQTSEVVTPISNDDARKVVSATLDELLTEINIISDVASEIVANSIEKYEPNEDEVKFLTAFYDKVIEANIEPYILAKKYDDGAIEIYYKWNLVGRVNLVNDGAYSMETLSADGSNTIIAENVDGLIANLPSWISYINEINVIENK